MRDMLGPLERLGMGGLGTFKAYDVPTNFAVAEQIQDHCMLVCLFQCAKIIPVAKAPVVSFKQSNVEA